MLKVGDKVPPFALTSDTGKQVSLAGLGSGPIVIYFYPRDDTPGCTREAQAFTAASSKFAKLGAQLFGVSKDTTASHCRFRDKYKLRVSLLSDPDLAVHKAFGAFGEKTMYGKKVQGTIRSTFIVQGGKVVHVFPNVKVDGHVEKVLEQLSSARKPSPKQSKDSAKAANTIPAKTAKKRAPKKFGKAKTTKTVGTSKRAKANSANAKAAKAAKTGVASAKRRP